MFIRTNVRNYADAYRVIQAMDLQAPLNTSEVREAARESLGKVLSTRMEDYIDQYLEEARDQEMTDRRNGYYGRHLLTELGDVFVDIPRTRLTSAARVLERYGRRSPDVDRAILSCYVLGCSTRKVAKALAPILDERVSSMTVSRIAKTLDDSVASFHKRPLTTKYRAVLFDGVVLSRKTGAGAVRRPVLTALGIRPDGKKEVIDWRLSVSESEAEWEAFMTDLYRRGLTEAQMEIIAVDGGKGALAALRTVYPGVPVQRCWAHKARNILDKVRVVDQLAAKRDLRRIYQAKNLPSARKAARRFADRWAAHYPTAVRCLQVDLEDLLTFFRFADPIWRRATRTTNAIERRFREVRRRTRPMGVFSDKTSLDRILFAVFTYENQSQGLPPIFLLTH
jgi:transposase-like protein